MSKAREETVEKPDSENPDLADDFAPETWSERWVKYGLNVTLTTILVVVLAFLVIWGAQRKRSRADLTSGGSYSLKPQTVSVISDLKSPVKLVSLYPRLKQEPGKGQDPNAQQQDFYPPGDGILPEDKRKGGDIDAELKEKIPDYKGRVKAVESSLNLFSGQVEKVRKALESLQNDEKAPQPIRDYAKNSLASYDAMKKQADDVLTKIKGLGELKLDDVRRRLIAPEGEQPPPAIAVMGENDIKLIDFKDVWKSGESTGFNAGNASGPPRLRFAREQQLTSAILPLAQPQKTKIAFIRGGGSPKTSGGGPFGGGVGDFSEIADRLKSYIFEVLEKDVSGQSVQRAIMG